MARKGDTGVYRPDLGSTHKPKAQAIATFLTLLQAPGVGQHGQVTEAQAIQFAIDLTAPLLSVYIQAGGNRDQDEAVRQIFEAVSKRLST